MSFHDLKFTITQNKISSRWWSPMQDPYELTQVAFLSSSSVASYTRGTPKMHGLPQTILLFTTLPVLCCAFFIQSAFRWHQLSGFMNFINISWLELHSHQHLPAGDPLYTQFSKPSAVSFHSGGINMPMIIFCRFCLHSISSCYPLT